MPPLTHAFDYAHYRPRRRLAEVPGSTLPSPYGGAPRQVMVDLDPAQLRANGLPPPHVLTAVHTTNPSSPSLPPTLPPPPPPHPPK
ncbi:efflux RND transporter permease subunit, partial [Methylobacterium radiotolerans]|uniref:efflux RND transporter permease subunit n=1 Tax=Methylobacterium radiotolerans TaxID=31998 RepID=UPI0015C5DB0E